MSTIYDMVIASHGSFPNKVDNPKTFNLPPNVELTFANPRGFMGYCNTTKDRRMIEKLQNKTGLENLFKSRHIIRGGEECINVNISFEENPRSSKYRFGIWIHDRSKPDNKPDQILTHPISTGIMTLKNLVDSVESVVLGHVTGEPKPYTLKIILNCCLPMPTETHGYSASELIDIYKLMYKTIHGSSINNYYNSIGLKPTVYMLDEFGKKIPILNSDGKIIAYKTMPAELSTHTPLYVSQLQNKTGRLPPNPTAKFRYNIHGRLRPVPLSPNKTKVRSLANAALSYKKRALQTRVNHTKNTLRKLNLKQQQQLGKKTKKLGKKTKKLGKPMKKTALPKPINQLKINKIRNDFIESLLKKTVERREKKKRLSSNNFIQNLMENKTMSSSNNNNMIKELTELPELSESELSKMPELSESELSKIFNNTIKELNDIDYIKELTELPELPEVSQLPELSD